MYFCCVINPQKHKIMEETFTQNMEPSNDNLEQKQYIKTTGKWMKFFGVLFIICIVFMFIGGICMFAIGGSLAQSGVNIPMPTGFLGFLYIVFGIFYIFPCRYLLKAAKAASALETMGSEAEVTDFLKNSKSYWKFVGIVTIISLVLVIVVLPIVIASAVAGITSAF